MKNSTKRILSILSCFAMALTPLTAFAQSHFDQPINGKIKTAVEFTGWSMQDVVSLYENGGLDTQELISKNLLYIDEQGEPALSITLPDLMVHVDEQPMNVDANQSFLVDDLAVGEHNVQVMNASVELLNDSFMLDENENEIQIEVHIRFDELMAGMEQHIQNMDRQSLNAALVIPSLSESGLSMSPMSDPDAYYQGHAVGKWFGENKGRMKMLDSDGHVSCNKAYHDHGANFPNNDSDCTKAVAFGVAYMSYPTYTAYYQGYYCVQEAMSSVFNESTANIYCNATPKSGGYYAGFKNKGYNCSSFTFLKGDERLSNY